MKKELRRYFFMMGKKEFEKIKEWLSVELEDVTEEQIKFLRDVTIELASDPDEYAIAIIEPSFDFVGRLTFCEDEPVAVGLSNIEWEKEAINFAPKYGSDLATIEELLLFYAYRIAMGWWTLEEVCDKPVYLESYDPMGKIKNSAYEYYGGFADGIGNTHKVVKTEDGYAVCGVGYSEQSPAFANSIATYELETSVRASDTESTGVIVLRKNI